MTVQANAFLLLGASWCLAGSPSPANGQTARDRATRAVAAMGGEQALRDLQVTTMDFHTMTFALGQEETPESPARATIAYGRIVTDWRSGRRAQQQEIRQLTGAVNRQRRITADGIGMLETDGRQAPDGAAAVAGVERSIRLSPERLLLSALDNPGGLTALPAKRWRGEFSEGVRYAVGPDTLDLYFDGRTGLLLVTETATDDGILGDRRTATWYTRWQAAGPVKTPRQVDVEVNGRLQAHTVYTDVTTGGASADAFAIADSVASRALRGPATPAPVVVHLVELAPNVWRAEGGSHHSLVIEQPRQLVVIEAPQNSVRSRAVLDTLRVRFRGKPVGLVVNTHHHWDHAGGLRGYLAAGITVVTHARNAGQVRRIAAAPKTVAPDQLSRQPREPVVRTVEDSLNIGEGETGVVVYRIPTAHVEGMLGAYVPAARLLFLSDVLTPGPVLARPSAAEVVAAIQALGITVERVAGGHGGVATWQQVQGAAR